MNQDNLNKLITQSLAIDVEEAKAAGMLGFMARSLVQATMPHSKVTESVFTRENGAFSLAMMANPKVGLPYGSVPRLLVAFLTTEAVLYMPLKTRHYLPQVVFSQFYC